MTVYNASFFFNENHQGLKIPNMQWTGQVPLLSTRTQMQWIEHVPRLSACAQMPRRKRLNKFLLSTLALAQMQWMEQIPLLSNSEKVQWFQQILLLSTTVLSLP